eukprot:TRINITY_DN2311_c0_g1_i1.p1 TRINITY_DN2311_c0_g1~~TRINITY_DN2311_c0_g1_i1.p1  ORF type:complete len:905 (-),score=120.59 TRINITY_DN2311_c0_g1_i1:102-2816(-)
MRTPHFATFPSSESGQDEPGLQPTTSQYVLPVSSGSSQMLCTPNHVQRGTLPTLTGVFIPTCENMWGVLIFLRFFTIVGEGGVIQAILAVAVSWLAATFTALSLSAISTNGPIEGGGVYYLISRTLGPRIGGAVGFLYYLGIVLLAVLESLGAVEVLLFTAGSGLDIPGALRLIVIALLTVIAIFVSIGIKFVSKLGAVFAVIVSATIIGFYVSLIHAPSTHSPSTVTGLSADTLRSNLGSDYSHGKGFASILAIFFPCYTGIFAGADRSSSLKDPGRSIPWGTLGAINFSLVLYVSLLLLWGAVADRDFLKSGGEGHASGNVVVEIAWPSHLALEIGIIIASFSQALQCMVVAPRLLQEIAQDQVDGFLTIFARITHNEPRLALLVSIILAIACAMIGSLDLVAPLISVCFLTCYGAINLSTFVLALLRAPSWRPSWRYFHWSTALAGCLLCIVLMFVIDWLSALIATILAIALWLYLDWKEVKADWGTGLGGLRLQIAVQSVLSLRKETRFLINWRPQLLVMYKAAGVSANGRVAREGAHEEMIEFAVQLKKGRGLCVVVAIVEGHLQDRAPQAEMVRLEMERVMESARLKGFARTVVAPSFREGKTFALQLLGLGGLEPNTLLEGWPHHWNEAGHEGDAEAFLETMADCHALQKTMLIVFNSRAFPRLSRPQGNIDVWWMAEDGCTVLLIAFLLRKHRIWAGCTLKLHVLVSLKGENNRKLIEESLREYLSHARIPAAIDVVQIDLPSPPSLDSQLQPAVSPLFAALPASPTAAEHRSETLSPATSASLNGAAEKASQSPTTMNNMSSVASVTVDLTEGKTMGLRPQAVGFSAAYLNQLILQRSERSQLVVINLPQPALMVRPREYMAYCESLVSDCHRVLFVAGGVGVTEAWAPGSPLLR